MRKTRSDSKLLHLPEDQQAKLADWLLAGMPYHVAQATVEKEFGFRVSLGAFTKFWEAVCAGAYIAKRQRAIGLADEVAAEARQTPGEFDTATLDALRQRAFELASAPGASAKDVKGIFTLLLKSRDQQLEERRIVLLEAKAAQADKTKDIVESTLTPQEKEAKIRQVFGM